MKELRQERILDYLREKNTASFEQLLFLTEASPATVRRDLAELAKQGKLLKRRGGAERLFREEDAPTGGFLPKPDPKLEEKRQIAAEAAALIETGDNVFVGAGMTGNLLCRFLAGSDKRQVTVVTPSVTAVLELASDPRFSILLLGGKIHAGKNHIETLDEFTVENLSQYYFNKAFFTVDGAELGYGYSIRNRSELVLYRYVLGNSAAVYLMLNAGKTDRKAFARFAGLNEISNVISNEELAEPYRTYYEEQNINLILVDKSR